MRSGEELRRRLAKLGDLRLDGAALDRVGDALDVDGALVRHVVEEVVGANRRG
jgi:hypothetical protein